jgi:AcrR family transcriptional regulator
MIAAAADLAPSAVYHYFGGKAALYEEVFESTAEAIWQSVDEALAHDTLLANMESIVQFTLTMSIERRQYSDFLALFPMESSLHPDFAHMLDWRSKRQDTTFRALAEIGIATGELDGFTATTGTE